MGNRPSVARRLLRNSFGMAGLVALGVVVLCAALAPAVAPYDPYTPVPAPDGLVYRWQPPSTRHWLGTDSIGRDVLSRVIYGARTSLGVALAVTVLAVSIGTTIGALAGFLGAWVDGVLMRLTDTLLSIPVTFLLIVLASLVRPSVASVILIIGVVYWTRPARVTRGEVLKVKANEFVQAAQALGATSGRIIGKHILPNIVSILVVNATLRFAYAILLEASLSFLGLGIQEPTPSWGRMLQQATSISNLEGRPWLWLPPGLAILVTVLSINFVGDALRDAIDPRLR